MSPGIHLDAAGKGHNSIKGGLGEMQPPEARARGALSSRNATHHAMKHGEPCAVQMRAGGEVSERTRRTSKGEGPPM